MEWVELLATKDLTEAEFIKGLLEAAEIPVVVKGENTALIFPGVLGEIRLWVPKDQEEAAHQVLSQEATALEDVE